MSLCFSKCGEKRREIHVNSSGLTSVILHKVLPLTYKGDHAQASHPTDLTPHRSLIPSSLTCDLCTCSRVPKMFFSSLLQIHTLKTPTHPSKSNPDVSLSLKPSLGLQAELTSPSSVAQDLHSHVYHDPGGWENKHHKITQTKVFTLLVAQFLHL